MVGPIDEDKSGKGYFWVKSCLSDSGPLPYLSFGLFIESQRPLPPAGVIAPQTIRAVGSSSVSGAPHPSLNPTMQLPKKPEEVEEEFDSEALAAVISDTDNKVRLANSAYKEMVGQPECPWLESMVTGEGKAGGNSCKRICGEVMLHLSDSRVPVKSNGFSCWVRIEWGSEGKKSSIKAFCIVIRLSCQSKDYLFTWRFHPTTGKHLILVPMFEI